MVFHVHEIFFANTIYSKWKKDFLLFSSEIIKSNLRSLFHEILCENLFPFVNFRAYDYCSSKSYPDNRQLNEINHIRDMKPRNYGFIYDWYSDTKRKERKKKRISNLCESRTLPRNHAIIQPSITVIQIHNAEKKVENQGEISTHNHVRSTINLRNI